jgi:hypothetical protein
VNHSRIILPGDGGPSGDCASDRVEALGLETERVGGTNATTANTSISNRPASLLILPPRRLNPGSDPGLFK